MSTSAKRQKTARGPEPASRQQSDEGAASQSQSQSQSPPPPPRGAASDAADNDEQDGTEEAAPKTFADLGVVDSLCEACEKLGWKSPTPIQQEAIPLALKGRDVIGLAETGSGKTGAFAIPMLTGLLDKPQPLFGLVLAPTRELATQIGQAFDALGASISLRCATIIGGLDMVSQAIALGKKPHVVVATPGRLLDHLEKTKGFSLMKLRFLVLDEADRMLDLDFSAIIEKLLKFLPRERQTLLFSATMSSKVEALQRASLRNPVRVAVSASKYQTVATLLQKYVFVPHVRKDAYLVYLANEHRGQSTVVFCRTVHETQRLAILLRALGFSAVPLHGQLSQTARLGALNKFRAGSRDMLVATDVAARGLDIPKVDVVLNYDLPGDSKTYIHRVGRTARAGKSGVALSLVTQYDLEIWLRIEKALGTKLDEYGLEKDDVMVLSGRVEEAQRHARNEMKALDEARARRGPLRGRQKGRDGGGRDRDEDRRGKRRADDMDAEEG